MLLKADRRSPPSTFDNEKGQKLGEKVLNQLLFLIASLIVSSKVFTQSSFSSSELNKKMYSIIVDRA